MSIKLSCVNITSKNPKALAEFYRTIEFPVFIQNDDYDGWNLGALENQGSICIWDENVWGKSTAGYITIVFNTDDLQATYEKIIGKGIDINPPRAADWGGQELVFNDPDGNIIMVL